MMRTSIISKLLVFCTILLAYVLSFSQSVSANCIPESADQINVIFDKKNITEWDKRKKQGILSLKWRALLSCPIDNEIDLAIGEGIHVMTLSICKDTSSTCDEYIYSDTNDTTLILTGSQCRSIAYTFNTNNPNTQELIRVEGSFDLLCNDDQTIALTEMISSGTVLRTALLSALGSAFVISGVVWIIKIRKKDLI